jgi:hypothetical protein
VRGAGRGGERGDGGREGRGDDGEAWPWGGEGRNDAMRGEGRGDARGGAMRGRVESDLQFVFVSVARKGVEGFVEHQGEGAEELVGGGLTRIDVHFCLLAPGHRGHLERSDVGGGV